MREPARPSPEADLPALSESTTILALEQRFTETFGLPHPVAVRSASAGFLNLLLALDLPADAEVLLPASLCQTMVNATLLARCIPVFVDTDATLAMDAADLERKRTSASRVVVFHHPHGLACDTSEVASICAKQGLFWVEDCAQALGARFQGQPIGFAGHASVFSFGPGKPLNVGFGGMVSCSSERMAKRLRLHARCGLQGFPDDRVLGWGSSLSEAECRQLTEAIAAFPQQLALRCQALEQACTALAEAGLAIQAPPPSGQLSHVFQRLLLDLPLAQAQAWQRQVGSPLEAYLQGPLPCPPNRVDFLKDAYQRCGRLDLWDPLGHRVPQFRHVSAKTHFLNLSAAYHQGHLSRLVEALCDHLSPAKWSLP